MFTDSILRKWPYSKVPGRILRCLATYCLPILNLVSLIDILFVRQFFFRLFADPEKDPPQLDYTQMLLYFACDPDAVEGVYRALSVAIGTHVFHPIETTPVITEKVIVFQKWTSIGVSRGMPEDPRLLTTESVCFSSVFFGVPNTALYT